MLREGDKIEKLTAIRAAIRSLFVSAAKGKTAALKIVFQAMNEIAAARVYYFAGNRRLARSVPTIVFPVNPPASTALR